MAKTALITIFAVVNLVAATVVAIMPSCVRGGPATFFDAAGLSHCVLHSHTESGSSASVTFVCKKKGPGD
jgi:hypothetical protein